MGTRPETTRESIIRIIETPLGFTIFYGIVAFIVMMLALIFLLILSLLIFIKYELPKFFNIKYSL
mgnify:CR=1 FL=1